MSIREFLEEDIGSGDITTAMTVPDTDGRAVITMEEDGIVAGLEEAAEVFAVMGCDSTPLFKDGDRVKTGSRVMSISGPLRGLITAERTALNFIMRMSGIATATSDAVAVGDGMIIAATRKTTPGFSAYEKKAVKIGGGDPHRLRLDSMILIKDNHIKACGSVRAAMEKVSKAPFSYKIEVEVSNVEDAVTATEMGADIIMADNTDPEQTGRIRDAVKSINDKVLIEASGCIGIDTLKDYVGVADIISMGCLTHSAKALQFSMDIL